MICRLRSLWRRFYDWVNPPMSFARGYKESSAWAVDKQPDQILSNMRYAASNINSDDYDDGWIDGCYRALYHTHGWSDAKISEAMGWNYE